MVLRLYKWQVESRLEVIDKQLVMPTECDEITKYNLAVMLMVQANTVTGRWVDAVRIAPTVALLKYRHDVGYFKYPQPQSHLTSQAELMPVVSKKRPTQQYIARGKTCPRQQATC